MDIRDREGLKREAGQRLASASYHPGKLTLIHGAAVVGLSLILSILSLMLSHSIEGTGGLSGIGARNILQTLQTLLNSAYSLLLPFWQIGIVFSFLCIVRHQKAGPETLTKGFRRFGPVLRLKLLEVLIYFIIGMICAYVSSFLAVNFSTALYELMEPIAMAVAEDPNTDIYALMEQIPPQQLLEAMLPMLVIFAVLYLAVSLLVAFRLRFAQYLVVDEPGFRALAAIRVSMHLTKGNCISLFKLDLSFWWYYLLQGLAVVISFADMILGAAGVQLPLSSGWTAIICYCAYGILILTLDYFCRPQVEATYALAYDGLKSPPSAPIPIEE